VTPLEVIDASGTGMSIPTPVVRAVSLVPSITETLFALEAGDCLVGRTRYCIHPDPDVRAIERIGGTKDPDVARIVALAPDLVLANREENLAPHIAELRAAGIPVHVSEPRTPDDALALVAFLGMAFERIEEAAAIVYQGELVLHELGEAASERAAIDGLRLIPRGKLRATALVWREPWMVAGGDTYIGGVLEALGFANAFGKRDRYPRVSVEELVAARPDVVLLPSEPYEFDEDDAAELAGLMGEVRGTGGVAGAHAGPAMPAPRLVLCSGEDLMWFGSRTPEALRRLRQVLA